MAASDPGVLLAIRDRLVSALHPNKIVLFGSRARGDARPDSDYDLLIVSDEPGSWTELHVAARRALSDLHVSKDVVVLTTAEYAKYRRWLSHIAAVADREGQVLYEAA